VAKGWLNAGRGAARGLLLSLSLVASGCVASAGLEGGYVYGYPTHYVDVDPWWIASYPSYWYHGRSAYWVGDRWYYDSPSGWVVFRHEPAELRRYRSSFPASHPAPYVYAPRGAPYTYAPRRAPYVYSPRSAPHVYTPRSAPRAVSPRVVPSPRPAPREFQRRYSPRR